MYTSTSDISTLFQINASLSIIVYCRSRVKYPFKTSVNLPESLGRTSTLQASLVVSEMVEPYGSRRTEPGPTHSKVPSMFSAAAPERAKRAHEQLKHEQHLKLI